MATTGTDHRHAAVLTVNEPSGRVALALYLVTIAVSSMVAVVGKVYFGKVGSYVGAGIYIAVTLSACVFMVMRDVRHMGASSSTVTAQVPPSTEPENDPTVTPDEDTPGPARLAA